MVVGLQLFQRVQVSISVEIAPMLLFLAVHADNRVASRFEFGSAPRDVLKLLVAVFNLGLQSEFLWGSAAAVVVLLEQFAHHKIADNNGVLAPQRRNNLARRQVRPAHLLIHRVTGCVLAQHFQELLVQLRPPRDVIRFAPAAWFPNALLHCALGQAADFASALAHRVATASQHLRDINPPALPKSQGFQTSEAAPIFLVQAVVISAHRFFEFGRIGFHRGLLASVLVKPGEYHCLLPL